MDNSMTGKVVELDVNDVLPNRFQPRIKFSEDSINELSESIKEHGVIQPIVVRPMGDKYEIIAGERRYKASLLAGKQTIPSIITNLNDKDSAEVALIENVQRKDLTPIEEAISYKKILDMGYLTQEELASKLGKNQSTVANKLRLLNLADEVQEAVLDEKISERHARSLLKLRDPNKQVELLNRIIENRLTVRKTDEEIANILNSEKEEMPIIIEEEKEVKNMNDNFDPFTQVGVAPAAPAANNNNFNPFFTEPVAPTTNPGFMDVTNIENNAQQINVEKPVVDLNSLLTPQQPAAPVEAPTVEPVMAPTPAPAAFPVEENNKFINIPEPVEAPVEETSTPAPATSSFIPGADMFNFNFQPVQPVAPVETPAVETTPAVEPTPVATPAPVENVQPMMEQPVQPVAFDFMQPNFDSIPSTEPIVQPAAVAMPTAPAMPVEQPAMEAPIELKPITPAFISSEDMPIPSMEAPAQPKKNINEAIGIIRDCIKNLENMGFVINSEEIDFEALYQINLKIDK